LTALRQTSRKSIHDFRLFCQHIYHTSSVCSVCVLTAHFQFEKHKDDARLGNEKDVRRLKSTFTEKRNCKFLELASPTRRELLDKLENEADLCRDFQLQEGKMQNLSTHTVIIYNLIADDEPSVLMVFIMSHGDRNGVIYTDHLLVNSDGHSTNTTTGSSESDAGCFSVPSTSTASEETPCYETFTTTEVLTRLKNLRRFESSLKMVFFGVCLKVYFFGKFNFNLIFSALPRRTFRRCLFRKNEM